MFRGKQMMKRAEKPTFRGRNVHKAELSFSLQFARYKNVQIVKTGYERKLTEYMYSTVDDFFITLSLSL